MAQGFSLSPLCGRCLLRARRQLSRPPSYNQIRRNHSNPPPPPPSGYSHLTNRSLISLSGIDSTKFLQGLITRNLSVPNNSPPTTSPFYAAFLNSQGRILNDVFIYPQTAASSPDEMEYLIEMDKEHSASLLKHFKRHKLRSKLKFRALDEGERSVWALWDDGNISTYHENEAISNNNAIACPDKRAPGMGYRLIASGDKLQTQIMEALPGDETSLQTYTLRRILQGVAEGQTEMARESALPMDSNVDIMNGIDFRKGCYVGQELTIRTHHRGVVRKRILPVQLYGLGQSPHASDSPVYEPDTNIILPPAGTEANISKVGTVKGRSAGKFLTGIGNVGLAVCRLEMMTDIALTGESTQYDDSQEFKVSWDPESGGMQDAGETRIKAFIPPWIRDYILSGGARHRQSRAQ
ncbi:ccr4 associated factor [Microsporum audouinii]